MDVSPVRTKCLAPEILTWILETADKTWVWGEMINY